MQFRRIDDHVSVFGQLPPAGVVEAAREGFTTIVNNRPDGEEPGQPTGAEIAAVAETLGLAYRAIPVTHAGFTEPQVREMAEVLGQASGPVLAFCRSGTRSTLLWALARSRMGDDADTLAAKAATAGYDLSPIRQHL